MFIQTTQDTLGLWKLLSSLLPEKDPNDWWKPNTAAQSSPEDVGDREGVGEQGHQAHDEKYRLVLHDENRF